MRFNTVSSRLCLSTLFVQSPELTPEAKYFLIRFHHVYGVGVVDDTVSVLSDCLGMSPAVTIKAREELNEIGFIEVKKIQPRKIAGKSGGRSRYQLNLTEKYFSDIAVGEFNIGADKPGYKVIKALLFWSVGSDYFRSFNHKKASGNSERMDRNFSYSPATRILLSILYEKCDAHGMVEALGISELSRLTGMNNHRIRSQFEVITALDWLLEKYSGLTSNSLFGKSKSVYFMNMLANLGDHEVSRDVIYCCFRFWFNTPYNYTLQSKRMYFRNKYDSLAIFEGPNCMSSIGDLDIYLIQRIGPNYTSKRKEVAEVVDIFGEKNATAVSYRVSLEGVLDGVVKLISRNGLFFDYKFDNKSYLFTHLEDHQLFEWCSLFRVFNLGEYFRIDARFAGLGYLQYYLSRVSSCILNEIWSRIEIDSAYISDNVLRMIKSDLNYAGRKFLVSDDVERSALAHYLYFHAYQMSIMVKGLVADAFRDLGINWSDNNGFSFSIIRVERNKVVMSLFKKDSIIDGQNFFVDVSRGNKTSKTICFSPVDII